MVTFSDGFESGNVSAWTGSNGVPVVDGTHAKSGVNGCELVKIGDDYVYKTIASNAEYYYRFYVYFTALQNTNSHSDFGAICYGTFTERDSAVCVKQYGGVMNFAMADGVTADFYDSGVAIDLDRWYCVELSTKINASGWLKLWVDGNLVCNEAKDTSARTNLTAVYSGYTWVGGVTFTAYIDDAVVDTSYIGPLAGGAVTGKKGGVPMGRIIDLLYGG